MARPPQPRPGSPGGSRAAYRRFIFATPILLLYVAIMMFVICVLGCASFIFGYTVMYGGLIWAAIVFAMVLLFQMAVTEAVFAVNPPTHYVFNSPIDPTRKVHAKVRGREPPAARARLTPRTPRLSRPRPCPRSRSSCACARTAITRLSFREVKM